MGDGRGPKLALLKLPEVEREALKALTRSRTMAQALPMRARIVSACAQGRSNCEVSLPLGVSLPTLGTWRERFVTDRLDGLFDEPRPGRPHTVSDADVERIVVANLESNLVERFFARSPTSSSAAGCTAASPRWRRTSGRGWTCGTSSRARTCGPRPQMRSWPASPRTANESKTRRTSPDAGYPGVLTCCFVRPGLVAATMVTAGSGGSGRV